MISSISITSVLGDGLDVPFIYETHSIAHALEIIQNTIAVGAKISKVIIK